MTAPAPLSVQALLLLASAVLSGAGDILIFQWARGRASWILLAGLAAWAVSLVLMGLLFRCCPLPLSIAVLLLIVVHLLLDAAWDLAAAGIRLTAWQWLGAALAAAALLLLHLGRPAAAPLAPPTSRTVPSAAGPPGGLP